MNSKPSKADIERRYQECRAKLRRRGQEHVLVWWDDLVDDLKVQLLSHIESISWDVVDPLIESHVLRAPTKPDMLSVEPAKVYPQRPDASQAALYDEARALGEAMIAGGKVCAFTVAGGQGTRLGFDGPKGMLPITPCEEKTLFQLFAETVGAVSRKYRVSIPWYIMTNPDNHQQTVRFLESRQYFGLSERDVCVFSQGMLPSFSFDGKLLTTNWYELALAPNGHGGALEAIVTHAADDMNERGIEVISYFQVDNPIVKIFDPLFIGLHCRTGSEMSTKVAPKVDDFERVGNVCLQGGRTVVIEYSDFPDQLATSRNGDGSRKFNVGNLGIHCIDVTFVERLDVNGIRLPYHRAEKCVTWMDANGFQRTPRCPNAVKLETFIFDALPLAQKPLLLEIDRSEEFSPVKNASGEDSRETAIAAQIARHARWLERAGVEIPRQTDGRPDVVVEIAPSYALDAEGVRVREAVSLQPGERIYISRPPAVNSARRTRAAGALGEALPPAR